MVHLELHQQNCQHKALREYQRLYSTIQPSWQPNSLLTLHAAPIRPNLNTANGANRHPPPTKRPQIYRALGNLRNQRLDGTQGVPRQKLIRAIVNIISYRSILIRSESLNPDHLQFGPSRVNGIRSTLDGTKKVCDEGND